MTSITEKRLDLTMLRMKVIALQDEVNDLFRAMKIVQQFQLTELKEAVAKKKKQLHSLNKQIESLSKEIE